MRVKVWKQRWKSKIACLVTMALILQLFLPASLTVWAKESKEGTEVTVIHAEEYGVDPNGLKDSTQAIQRAFEAAKEAKEAGAAEVVVDFPKGEYHIYKDYAEKTVYFGPMGCRTGFYLILAGDYESKDIIELLKEMYGFMRDFQDEVPGACARDCGNYLDMNLPMANYLAKKFYEEVLCHITEERLNYSE